MKSRHIGLHAGQALKCRDGLMHAHSAAVEHARAFGERSAQECGLHRRVNDVGGPMPGLDGGDRNRTTGKAAHADLRGVDDAVGPRDVVFKAAREAATRCAVLRRQLSLKGIGTRPVEVMKDQFGNALSAQPAFTWTSTGYGSVSSSGLYTAPYASGTASIIRPASARSLYVR